MTERAEATLPHYRALPRLPVDRLTRARAREGVNGENPVMRGNAVMPPPSQNVTILRHCRCADCRKFSKASGQYFCSEYIGGTFVVWASGMRVCEPAPDAWHYCSCYDGPQISKDVWVWKRDQSK